MNIVIRFKTLDGKKLVNIHRSTSTKLVERYTESQVVCTLILDDLEKAPNHGSRLTGGMEELTKMDHASYHEKNSAGGLEQDSSTDVLCTIIRGISSQQLRRIYERLYSY